MVSEDDTVIAKFTITAITVDAQCTEEYAMKPENGHILALDVTMETTPELADVSGASFALNSFDFKSINPDGSTSNADLGSVATFGCFKDAETLPSDMGPGETATGKVVLDSETAEGTLIYKPILFDEGYEWSYPAK